MNYLFIGLEVVWFSIIVITGMIIMRNLNDKGIKETMLYSIFDLVDFFKYAKKQNSIHYKAVFWLYVIAFVMIFVTAIAAAVYYN